MIFLRFLIFAIVFVVAVPILWWLAVKAYEFWKKMTSDEEPNDDADGIIDKFNKEKKRISKESEEAAERAKKAQDDADKLDKFVSSYDSSDIKKE